MYTIIIKSLVHLYINPIEGLSCDYYVCYIIIIINQNQTQWFLIAHDIHSFVNNLPCVNVAK